MFKNKISHWGKRLHNNRHVEAVKKHSRRTEVIVAGATVFLVSDTTEYTQAVERPLKKLSQEVVAIYCSLHDGPGCSEAPKVCQNICKYAN